MNNYFTMDNTEGYTQSQLAELNARFDAKLSDYTSSMDEDNSLDKSEVDFIAERILKEFDTELTSKS